MWKKISSWVAVAAACLHSVWVAAPGFYIAKQLFTKDLKVPTMYNYAISDVRS
jgi:hypothetical protein